MDEWIGYKAREVCSKLCRVIDRTTHSGCDLVLRAKSLKMIDGFFDLRKPGRLVEMR